MCIRDSHLPLAPLIFVLGCVFPTWLSTYEPMPLQNIGKHSLKLLYSRHNAARWSLATPHVAHTLPPHPYYKISSTNMFISHSHYSSLHILSTTAVSYTHLDVYKRQVWGYEIIILTTYVVKKKENSV